MRVALLSHSANAGDAIGRQVAEKVAFFLDRGAEVRLFVESDRRLHSGLRPYTTRIQRQPRSPAWSYLTTADLIIVEYSQYFGLIDTLAVLAGGKPRILFDYHGVTPVEFAGPNNRDALERGRRLRGMVWYADAAIVHSKFTRSELLDATNLPRKSTFGLGYPIDGERLRQVSTAQPLRERIGLSGNATILLFVGRLAPNKRVPILVEAVSRLRARIPNIHAVIVGEAGDVYENERQRCRERAERLGVADRVHFIGHADEPVLCEAYRSADILVIPSVHEGFCFPLIEAMACGLPVMAARATALPETVSDAGLTFRADNVADLVRQVQRLLESRPAPSAPLSPRRVAVVTPRYGTGFVGGAETSLRILADSMHAAGCDVTVFTTCAGNGRVPDNHLPERSAVVERYAVHRFRTDAVDADRYARADVALRHSPTKFDADEEYALLANSLRSSRLIDSLRQHGPFDAIFVGPYLLGLTFDVARAFPDRTIVIPCFHDEPFARLPALLEAYESVGGVLYHSPEERQFAEASLGLNHSNAHVVGTCLERENAGDAGRGRARVPSGQRFVLYCGRFHRDKGLPDLLDYARRYTTSRPGQFTFVFAGMGDVAIPSEPWALDLGYVKVEVRRDLMAAADALVQLSPNESLSLVVIEAQLQGTPVVVRTSNEVLAAHISRGEGGCAVETFEEFAAALDDLWNRPDDWRVAGDKGRNYARHEFGNPAAYRSRWQAAIDQLNVPLVERMRRNGFQRAKEFDRTKWREQFASVVEQVIDLPARTRQGDLRIVPRVDCVVAIAGTGQSLIPVRLSNRGLYPETPDGPARTELVSRLIDDSGQQLQSESVTPLPGLLLPGQDIAGVVRIVVPKDPGHYSAELGVSRHSEGGVEFTRICQVRLTAVESGQEVASRIGPLPGTLLAAHAAHRLPDEYADVSTGRFARLKRWAKRKLLHNFQTAYVDVLSRQQTAFNSQMLLVVTELTDAHATLAHATKTNVGADTSSIQQELQELRRRYRQLARRCRRLENVTGRPRATPRLHHQESAI